MPSRALLEIPIQVFALILRRLLPRLNDLEKENLFLRYQLLVLKRQTKQVRVSQADRSFLAVLSQGFRGWKEACCHRRSPLANAKIERVNGTLQRECTDHFLFFNERQLQKALSDYQEYYNRDRCHQAFEQRTPGERGGGVPKVHASRLSEITSRKYLSGLRHGYRRAAA